MAKLILDGEGVYYINPRTPSIGGVEKWKFYTNILRAIGGDEEAVSITDTPQINIDFSWVYEAQEIAEGYNLFYGAMRENWIVPLWYFLTPVESYDYLNNTLVVPSVNMRPFEAGKHVLIKNKNQWQVIKVSSIDGDIITVGGLITVNLNGANIIPCAKGFIEGDLKRVINAKVTQISVNYILTDFTRIPSATPSKLYKGFELWDGCMVMGSGSGEVVFSQQQDVFDGGIGLRAQRTTWDKPYTTKRMILIAENRDEAYKQRMWIMFRCGQARPFYAPLYETIGEVLNTTFITNKLRIRSSNYSEVLTRRKHIGLKIGEVWKPFEISYISQISEDDFELTLLTNVNINPSSIKNVTYFSLHRLGTDMVQFNEIGGGKTTVEIPLVEV